MNLVRVCMTLLGSALLGCGSHAGVPQADIDSRQILLRYLQAEALFALVEGDTVQGLPKAYKAQLDFDPQCFSIVFDPLVDRGNNSVVVKGGWVKAVRGQDTWEGNASPTLVRVMKRIVLMGPIPAVMALFREGIPDDVMCEEIERHFAGWLEAIQSGPGGEWVIPLGEISVSFRIDSGEQRVSVKTCIRRSADLPKETVVTERFTLLRLASPK